MNKNFRNDGYISANGINIYYKECGAGPSLILSHGGTDTHKFWDPFILQFSEHFRVFTPDSRGHGRTTNPSRELSYRLMADDLAAFIQKLQIKDPLIFGYSDGGQVALDFGMRYPDIAAALVIGGAWYQFSKEYQDALKKAGFTGPGDVNYEIIDKNSPPGWIDRMRNAHPSPDPDYYQTLLRDISKMWWTPLNYQPDDFQKIISPTLILMAENDEMIPVSEAREMVEMIPNAKLKVILGASHNDIFQKGEEVLKDVIDFFLCYND